MSSSQNASGNPVTGQPSIAKSLLILGVAGALGVLIGDSREPAKEDEPFGEPQSRREQMQTQLQIS
jgi:hypothetical protein